MLGYAYGCDDLARGREVASLETGDLGHIDADGFLYVIGRSSRFAKVLGRRVSLDDVEEWFGPVGRVAAVAGPDDSAIVIFTTEEPATLELLRQEVAATLGAPGWGKALTCARRDQSAGTISATRFRSILPAGVCGILSTRHTCLGTLKSESR